MAKRPRNLINQERSKWLQDLGLARWLRHNLNCAKAFGESHKRRNLKWAEAKTLAEGQERCCSLRNPVIRLLRVPPGGAQLGSEPLCARHSMGVHRGTACTPAAKRGSPGAFGAHQARQQSRACFGGVLQERGDRQDELLGCTNFAPRDFGWEGGGCVYTLHVVLLTSWCYVSLNPFKMLGDWRLLL